MSQILPAVLACIVPIVCYVVSLRRTPYANLWGIWTLLVLILAEIVVFGAPHASTVGRTAGSLMGIGALSYLPAMCTEIFAHDLGSINKYRSKPKKISKSTQWEIETKFDYHSKCVINVVRGDSCRFIGSGDPLIDHDAWLDLKVRAEEAVRTYNQENIQ
jgi:hypothetical protein